MELPKSQLLNPQGFRIGHAAKRIRDGKGLSIEFVAGEIGLDAESYVQIEADQFLVSEEMLLLLSKALNVSILDLLSAQYQAGILNHNASNEPGFSTSPHNVDMERLYHEQIKLLRDEISYLRSMLEIVAKKD